MDLLNLKDIPIKITNVNPRSENHGPDDKKHAVDLNVEFVTGPDIVPHLLGKPGDIKKKNAAIALYWDDDEDRHAEAALLQHPWPTKFDPCRFTLLVNGANDPIIDNDETTFWKFKTKPIAGGLLEVHAQLSFLWRKPELESAAEYESLEGLVMSIEALGARQGELVE